MSIISDGILNGATNVVLWVIILKIFSFVQMYGRMFLVYSIPRIVIVFRIVFDVYDSIITSIIVFLITLIQSMSMRPL